MTVEGLIYLAVCTVAIAGLQLVMAHPKAVITIGALGLAIASLLAIHGSSLHSYLSEDFYMSKLAMSNYDTAFTYTVGGIPCTITLSEISSTPARRDAHCSDELHEQIDFEWDAFDRKGYRAPWLSRKVKPTDLEYFTQQAYEWLHHDDE